MSKENPDFLIAANLAHEIQNPVQAILGLCETNLPMQNSPESAQVLQKIQNCAEELSNLVQDVLEFARFQQGQSKLSLISFDPVSALHETLASLYPKARAKGIELLALTPADAPEQIRGDKIKFKRILTNLVQNAVKFTGKGTIQASLDFQKSATSYHVEMKVKDTGIGIPQQRLPFLFQPFTQAETNTAEYYGGSGLGLAMVQSLARAMGGEVHVESDIGKGSCFTVKLNCASVRPLHTTSPKILKAKKILLQCSCPHLQPWLIQSLQFWGAKVITAPSTEEINKIIGNENFDYLIIDIPVDTSPQLPQCNSTPTILLTDFDYPFHGYQVAPKPVNLQTLRHLFEDKKPHTEATPSLVKPKEKTDRSLRILVAEDNEVNREVISLQLKRAGHDVSVAVDGVATLELWRIKEFDLVILDLQMPLLGGIEVATTIRREEKRLKRKPIPLIALTGINESGQRAHCKKAGLETYLVKPLRGSDLIEKIKVVSQSNDLPDNIDEFTKNLRLADEQEAEDLKCAARVFLKYSHSFIEKLQTALAKNDPKDIRFQAHAVSGMLGMMGCTKLVHLAGQIDRKPRDPQAIKRTKQLIDGLQRLEEALRSSGDLTADGQT